jgi:hypothetical protein
MVGAQIIFLGAGKANVVVDLPLHEIPNAPPPLCASGAATQRVAVRIRSTAHKECADCYRALKAYAGSRHVVPLPPALFKAIEAVIPPEHHNLIKGATEATIVPNFTSDPAQLLRMDLAAGDEPGRVADYTVEVKPKSAWEQPQVIGIVVDGTTYWINEAKHHHCRYAQMLIYKEARDAKKEEVHAKLRSISSTNTTELASSASSPFCPNYLFRPSLSSREGLRRLMHSPQNNLKMISHHPSRAQPHCSDPKKLTVEELDGIADAIDESGVLGPLTHLQLCGCAPPCRDEPADVVASKSIPVLDVELLYRWCMAKDKAAVEWLVLPADPAAQCSCIATKENHHHHKSVQRSEAQRVRPKLDLRTCAERFYVSTTARDVSLLVAVSSRRGEPDTSTAWSRLTGVPAEIGGVFVQCGMDVYRVGVVDLDDKRHKPLEHYYLHDQEIVEAFTKNKHR